MYLGVVGSEEAKFTQETKRLAIEKINTLIYHYKPIAVVSGKCHLGGIDIWAVEVASALGIKTIEYPPKTQSWPDYRVRNLQIAKASDVVVCITVKKLPENYNGMKFGYCYHCKTNEHIKSGGCWTMKQAIALGKVGLLEVIDGH